MEQIELSRSYEEKFRELERKQNLLLDAIAKLHHDVCQPLTSLAAWIELSKCGLSEEEDAELAEEAFLQLRDLIHKFRTLEIEFRSKNPLVISPSATSFDSLLPGIISHKRAS